MNTRPLHNLAAMAVAVLVLGSFALSGAAYLENDRFNRAADQVLGLVNIMRSAAAQQPSFAQTAGENAWIALSRIGQIPADPSRANPWGGEVKATILTNAAIRIDNAVPVHICRRLAAFILDKNPQAIGLFSMDARGSGFSSVQPIYPQQAGRTVDMDEVISKACGEGPTASLGVIFRFR